VTIFLDGAQPFSCPTARPRSGGPARRRAGRGPKPWRNRAEDTRGETSPAVSSPRAGQRGGPPSRFDVHCPPVPQCQARGCSPARRSEILCGPA
jgi:hypothetical protein